MKMKSNFSSVASNQEETYARTRDNPYFNGMRRGEAIVVEKTSAYDFQGRSARQNVYRSTSDIVDRGSRNISVTACEEDTEYSPKNSIPDIVLEPIGRSSSGRWSKTSSPLVLLSNSDMNFNDLNEPSLVSSSDAREAKKDFSIQCMESVVRRPYGVSRGQTDISNVPLPPSAAIFYYGPFPQMEVVELCESVFKLNKYLKARKDDVNAGVPGKLLRAVIGPDAVDVGSVASTIVYAFYLDQTLKGDQFCSVPVINMRRANLDSHTDLQWLLQSCHIDASSLIFIDEIDLSYYDLFGSLNLVLVNCDKIPSEQEPLKEAIVEVFHCTKPDASYSSVDSVIVRQDVSSCTAIAEKFTDTSPEILAGKGFSRLLLAGILFDTGNLTNLQCTSKDKYMATLLINGAGRFGCNGLYQILKYKSYGSSDLKVDEILRKEFKKWTRSGNSSSSKLATNVGMSSIGTSVAQLVSHCSTAVQEVTHFQQTEKLGLLIVVSGFYDPQNKFKREILVSVESTELMKGLLIFLNSNSSNLLLKPVVNIPGVLLKEGMRIFETDKVTSRRTIERLLDDFLSSSGGYDRS